MIDRGTFGVSIKKEEVVDTVYNTNPTSRIGSEQAKLSLEK